MKKTIIFLIALIIVLNACGIKDLDNLIEKEECSEQWKAFEGVKETGAFIVEENKLTVTFKDGTTLNKALEILKKYDLKKLKVENIFPIGDNQMTEIEIFNAYRRILVEAKDGKTAFCKLLNDKEVETVAPVMNFDISKIQENN